MTAVPDPGWTSFAPGALLGSPIPRLFTPPLVTGPPGPCGCGCALTPATSRGFEITEFAADVAGEPFMPWQRWISVHAFELLPSGLYRFRTVLVLVARQSGKSTWKRVVSVWRLSVDEAKLVLGVAQDVSLAREQWTMAQDTIRASDDLAAELGTVRRVNGDEWFRLSAGRYKIAAANRRAARGLSVDELNIDELREMRSWDSWSALSKTTMARPQGMTVAMSNAGDDTSVVLNQLREAALAGRDDSLGIFEWSGPEGCAIDDPDAWRAANPGLGYTVSEAAIRSALGTDPESVFRTEVLCQRVKLLDPAVDPQRWSAGLDVGTLDAVRDRVALCVDLALDGRHATLAAAAVLADGRVRVELVRAWEGRDAAQKLRDGIGPLVRRIKPRVVGWFPSGPAAAVASELADRKRSGTALWPPPGVTVEEIRSETTAVCMGLADLVDSGQLAHSGDPLLDAQVQVAEKLRQGDAWRFTRRGAGHVDAVYAAAGAAHLARTLPPPAPRPLIVVPKTPSAG